MSRIAWCAQTTHKNLANIQTQVTVIGPFAICHNQNHQKNARGVAKVDISTFCKKLMRATHSHIWPMQLQHAPSKVSMKQPENQQLCPRGLQLASHEALLSRRVCIKNSLTCILNNQFSEFGAQFGSARNAFGTTHSDSERNSHPYFWLAIFIAISVILSISAES